MTSFAQKIAAGNQRRNIYLVTGGKDYTDREAWYYVQIEPHLKLQFEHAIKAGNAVLTDFGSILKSGYGATPPDTACAYMKTSYQFEE